MRQAKRETAGIVIGTASGAIGGGLVGAFVLGLPGVVAAAGAALVGVFMGGYAGAIIGGLFGSERPSTIDT
ncbi:MAG TPA: hypothetical protein VFL27_01975 [Candidatus Dormibacteraeota bacterium]|nr:hypothetical protein [Candidatus Dormibacteraeota bacterium]